MYKNFFVTMSLAAMFLIACQQKETNQPREIDAVLSEQKEYIRTDDSKRLAYWVPEKDTISCQLTIFKRNDTELIIERDTSWYSYCYAVKDGVKRKLVFGQEYLDEGAAELTYYAYDRYLYIVGDIKPNSNGWTCRYSLYRIDKGDFSLKFIYSGAAIHFSPHEIIVADARLTNPDADCTADEVWVMHDVHFDVNGNKIREDKKEYDYKRMEQKYGEDFVNTTGIEE